MASKAVQVDGSKLFHMKFGGHNGTFGSESSSRRGDIFPPCFRLVLSPLASALGGKLEVFQAASTAAVQCFTKSRS